MKRVYSLLCLILLLTIPFFSGCKNQTLLSYVTELRSDILVPADDFPLKAYILQKETPLIADGKVTERSKYVKFIYTAQDINASYTVTFSINGKEYSPTFSLNHLSGNLVCEVEIDNFNEKRLEVILNKGNELTEITLTSIIPEGTITVEQALINLEKEQQPLVDSYKDENGNFNGEITARILVKDGKPYWYLGLINSNTKKALLVDGTNGKILAIRDIFGD